MRAMDKFKYQKLVASMAGPESPTTRHLLLTISLFMDENGANCFPSTKTLAEATGLTERTVCTHLEQAINTGWLKRSKLGKQGRGWRRSQYNASIPDKALKEIQHHRPERTETNSAPTPHGTERGSVRKCEGTESDDINVLKEVQSNISIEQSVNNKCYSFLLKDGSHFEIEDEFYQILKTSYPKLDIDAELKKIKAWCYSHTENRKTRRGAKKFINGWMNRNSERPYKNDAIQPPAQHVPKDFDFENQFHQTA